LLDGARIPKADELPEDLKELALRNGMEIHHVSFQDDMTRLIRGLKGDGVYLAGEDTSEFPAKAHGAESQLKDGLWGFLRDKGNQQVLGWLGGGWSLWRRDFGRPLSISSLLGNLPRRNLQSQRLPASRQTVVALPSAAM
jgi:hypothetical protein